MWDRITFFPGFMMNFGSNNFFTSLKSETISLVYTYLIYFVLTSPHQVYNRMSSLTLWDTVFLLPQSEAITIQTNF